MELFVSNVRHSSRCLVFIASHRCGRPRVLLPLSLRTTTTTRVSTTLPYIGTNHDGSRIIFNRDVNAKRNECVFPRYPKCVIIYPKENEQPQDAWVVMTFLECFIFVVVPGVMLFFVGPNEKTRGSFWYGFVWFVITRALFLQRFLLALHYHTHVNAIRAKKNEHFKRCLNVIPTFIIAPFFGIPAGIYWYHHNAMHHVHGNAHDGFEFHRTLEKRLGV